MIEAGPFGSSTVTLSPFMVKTYSLHVLEFQHLNQMTWSFRGAMDGFGEGEEGMLRSPNGWKNDWENIQLRKLPFHPEK